MRASRSARSFFTIPSNSVQIWAALSIWIKIKSKGFNPFKIEFHEKLHKRVKKFQFSVIRRVVSTLLSEILMGNIYFILATLS